MVSNMPAIVAMEKYCEEVENFNQNWWQLMTENCTYEEKAKMLSMADESSEEYYLQVGMRLLVPPTGTGTTTSSSSSEREGIGTFGSVIFSGGERSSSSPRKGRGGKRARRKVMSLIQHAGRPAGCKKTRAIFSTCPGLVLQISKKILRGYKKAR